MDPTLVSEIMRDAVGVCIKLGAPMLLLSMLVGVVVAIFQAVTQIHPEADCGGYGTPGGRKLDDGHPARLCPQYFPADQ